MEPEKKPVQQGIWKCYSGYGDKKIRKAKDIENVFIYSTDPINLNHIGSLFVLLTVCSG